MKIIWSSFIILFKLSNKWNIDGLIKWGEIVKMAQGAVLTMFDLKTLQI